MTYEIDMSQYCICEEQTTRSKVSTADDKCEICDKYIIRDKNVLQQILKEKRKKETMS